MVDGINQNVGGTQQTQSKKMSSIAKGGIIGGTIGALATTGLSAYWCGMDLVRTPSKDQFLKSWSKTLEGASESVINNSYKEFVEVLKKGRISCCKQIAGATVILGGIGMAIGAAVRAVKGKKAEA